MVLAEINREIVGYIQWTEKSGFRKEVVLELEQIGVLSNQQNQGIGTKLILESLIMIKKELIHRQAFIKHILISTRTDNDAQKLYKKVLNAKSEVIIGNLFSADEVLMISRNIVL